jgi:hypothetical protein
MNLQQNPLHVVGIKVVKTPIWLCKHSGALVLDYELKKYKCEYCARGKVIRKYSQEELLSTIGIKDTLSH